VQLRVLHVDAAPGGVDAVVAPDREPAGVIPGDVLGEGREERRYLVPVTGGENEALRAERELPALLLLAQVQGVRVAGRVVSGATSLTCARGCTASRVVPWSPCCMTSTMPLSTPPI
jgi:hypothetical protein